MTSLLRTLLLVLCLGAWANPSDKSPAPTELTWTPVQPSQGEFIHLEIRPPEESQAAGRIAVRGYLAGQPLHFERGREGGFHALAGVPVNAGDSVKLTYMIERSGQIVERGVTQIPVERRVFSVAQLSVDPRFVEPPDSALAVRIARENRSAGAVSRRSHSTPRLWLGEFALPRDSRITSEYGQRREFNGELRNRHMGLDLAGDFGSTVLAANRGVVALIGEFYYAGNVIYVDHGRGLVTAYLHMSEIEVAVGDTVRQGQEIGKVGASGRVTGPHLHWIARYGSITVNPLSLFKLELDEWDGGG